MKFSCLVIIAFLCLPVAVDAQQRQVPAQPKPKEDEPAPTKFEKFLSKKGVLYIKDFYDIGTVQGMYSTTLKIQAIVVSIAGEPTKVYAVKFTRPTTRQYGDDQSEVIDFDELVSMDEALGVMMKTAPEMKVGLRPSGTATPASSALSDPIKPLNTNQAPYSEVIFSTRGGLRVGFFQQGTQQVGFATLNDYSSDAGTYFGVEQLGYLRTLLSQAREKLSSLGAR